MEFEDQLWRRVAALRGIGLTHLGERAHVLGDRFAVQIIRPRSARPTTPIPERVRVSLADTCRGVIGEIVAGDRGRGDERRDPESARAQRPLIASTALGWRRALIEREAERLARHQPERGSR